MKKTNSNPAAQYENQEYLRALATLASPESFDPAVLSTAELSALYAAVPTAFQAAGAALQLLGRALAQAAGPDAQLAYTPYLSGGKWTWH